jgi:hypothetical protein
MFVLPFISISTFATTIFTYFDTLWLFTHPGELQKIGEFEYDSLGVLDVTAEHH